MHKQRFKCNFGILFTFNIVERTYDKLINELKLLLLKSLDDEDNKNISQ